MSSVFTHAIQISKTPIVLSWDTSNVTTMCCMFSYCHQDFILDFKTFIAEDGETILCDTRKVIDMSWMFCYAFNFNNPVNFDTRNVKNMAFMFDNAFEFNHPVNFDTRKVINMLSMFKCACKFNHPVKFDTSNITSMSNMFSHTLNFNQPLNFDTSNVRRMNDMFAYAIHFNQPLHFDTWNVTDMSMMFCGALNFEHPIYFRSCDNKNHTDIFTKSPLKGKENIYILSNSDYHKLHLFYILDKINNELPYLCYDFDIY